MRSILTHPSRLACNMPLNEKFEMAATPEGLKGITLMPHQATVVAAMHAVEQKRILCNFDTALRSGEQFIVESNSMVLSEPFGSGKTIELLALVLGSQVKALPIHVNLVGGGEGPGGFTTEVTKKYVGRALLSPTLVVVGSSVVMQWKDAVERHTNLRMFVVGNYYALEKFYKLYLANGLNDYDIVILKNGVTTGKFALRDEAANANKGRSILKIVCKMTQSDCWARVIYDDFDTIKIPKDALCVNSLFTIYVSATKNLNACATRGGQIDSTYTTLFDALDSIHSPIRNMPDDRILFKNFNIRNSPSFVESSVALTRINKYAYLYANVNDGYINILNSINDSNTQELVEMLNGDAIATAAESLGIKANSIACIFTHILGGKYNRYIECKLSIERVQALVDSCNLLPLHPKGKRPTEAALAGIICSVQNGTKPDIKYKSQETLDALAGLLRDYSSECNKNGIMVDRVISNIREGSCQVCYIPIGTVNAFINKCCGTIICEVCGIKGNQIHKTYDNKLTGSCANCFANLDISRDMVFIDSKLNIESLLTARGDEATIAMEAGAVVSVANPKIEAILDIIAGRVPRNRTPHCGEIGHLMVGKVDNPMPEGMPRKVLIFANYEETLKLVETTLRLNGIYHIKLGGTHYEIARSVERFKANCNVLLINSQQFCAGLNLENCTDLVFFHNIINSHVESQVAGRAQRIGRQYNLNIHYLNYLNEKIKQ